MGVEKIHTGQMDFDFTEKIPSPQIDSITGVSDSLSLNHVSTPYITNTGKKCDIFLIAGEQLSDKKFVAHVKVNFGDKKNPPLPVKIYFSIQDDMIVYEKADIGGISHEKPIRFHSDQMQDIITEITGMKIWDFSLKGSKNLHEPSIVSQFPLKITPDFGSIIIDKISSEGEYVIVKVGNTKLKFHPHLAQMDLKIYIGGKQKFVSYSEYAYYSRICRYLRDNRKILGLEKFKAFRTH